MKVKDLLKEIPKHLRRDAQLILAHLLRVSPPQIYLLEERELSEEDLKTFRHLLARRERGEPTAYIIGEWEFFGKTFRLERGVLVPRPETELLVEVALSLIPEKETLEGLEIGVGSGCVSVVLLLERPKLRMVATDVSERSLKVAGENARMHGVVGRIELIKADLFPPYERRFDFILSNPPYIPLSEWKNLPREVKWEDKTALLGGPRGTEIIERIVRRSRKFLKEGGFIALEIGHDQVNEVKILLEDQGFEVNIYKDLGGLDRVALGLWKS